MQHVVAVRLRALPLTDVELRSTELTEVTERPSTEVTNAAALRLPRWRRFDCERCCCQCRWTQTGGGDADDGADGAGDGRCGGRDTSTATVAVASVEVTELATADANGGDSPTAAVGSDGSGAALTEVTELRSTQVTEVTDAVALRLPRWRRLDCERWLLLPVSMHTNRPTETTLLATADVAAETLRLPLLLWPASR